MVFVTSLSLSCSKEVNNAAPSTQGGQDSGGGDTVGSTYGQIEYFLKDKKTLISDLNFIFQKLLTEKYAGADRIPGLLENKDFQLYNKIISRIDELNKEIDEEKSKSEKPGYIVHMEGTLGQTSPEWNPPFGCENLNQYDCHVKIQKLERNTYKKTISFDMEDMVNYNKLFPLDISSGHPHRMPDKIWITEILSKLKIELNYAEPCKDLHNKSKAGAVSDFSLDSKICLSLPQLSKIPADSLKKQIHGLLMHEILHLFGFYEEDANTVHNFILENYNDLFNNKTMNFSSQNSLSLKPAQLNQAIKLVLLNPKENFGLYAFYQKESFKENMSLISMLTEEGLVLIDSYIIAINENQQSKNIELEMISTIHQLKNILSELRFLHLTTSDFSSVSEQSFYKYSSPEEYYFIYDRLSFFSKKLKIIDKKMPEKSN